MRSHISESFLIKGLSDTLIITQICRGSNPSAEICNNPYEIEAKPTFFPYID